MLEVRRKPHARLEPISVLWVSAAIQQNADIRVRAIGIAEPSDSPSTGITERKRI